MTLLNDKSPRNRYFGLNQSDIKITKIAVGVKSKENPISH